MSEETHRIRLVPYSKAKGALARRFCVGGQLFIAGRWYVVSAQHATALDELKQGTGCPYFEHVVGDQAWKNIVRKELAEAVGGPGAAALAELAMAAPVPGAPPKAVGEVRTSRFDGLRAAEVDDGATMRAAMEDVVARPPVLVPTPPAAPVPDEPVAKALPPLPDLEAMTKGQLVRLGSKHGLDLDSRTLKSELIAALKAEVYEVE